MRARSSPRTDSRIALVRHGPSSHVQGGWVDATGFRAWRAAYESAGIRLGARVPTELQAILTPDARVIASDAARAVASARLLAGDRDVTISPLLRELSLDAPPLGGLRMPLAGWALAVAARVLLRSLRARELTASESMRIAEAVGLLETIAADAPVVVAVTHGAFRRALGARLREAGWRPEPVRRSHRPWSTWVYRRGDAARSR